MDFNQRPKQQQQEPQYEEQHHPQQVQKKRGLGKKLLKIFLVLLIIAGGFAAGWAYRDSNAKDESKLSSAEIESLKKELASTSKKLADISAKEEANKPASSCTGPTKNQIDNIKAAIESGNTAAIEGYMQTSVNVILAASEAYGPQTPAQAIKDLDYLDKATKPWDFNLKAEIISDYQKGDYKQYFPNGALVGKSANNYVVSFQFDSCGKIYGIFMSADASLL
jgi:hypothetical protein